MSTVEQLLEEPEEDGDSAWLLVFLNLLLVVLAFFIALVSLMHFDKRDKPEVKKVEQKEIEKALALREKLKKELEAAGLKEADVDMHRGQPRIVLPANVFFASGKADLAAEAKRQLASVASTVKQTKKRVLVEGHTDDRPIHTRRFPSNWELSAARALAVVQLFISVGINAERLEIAGYGEYQPRHANTSPENRRRNRRIEIKLR